MKDHLKMNEWLSNKFKWLSFFATWAVVVLHSGVYVPGCNAGIDVIREVIGKYVLWAVPLFFVISGYLFCLSYEKYGWKVFFVKKVKTLYVPVVGWCFLTEILVLPTTLYEHDVPGIRAWMGSFLLLINIDAWAPSSSLHSVSQLWYVRDLIFWFALAPVLYFIGKWRWWSILAALLGAYGIMQFGVFWAWRYEFRFVWLGLFFLVCGMVLYHSGLALKRLDKKVAGCVFLSATVLSILTGAGMACFIEFFWFSLYGRHTIFWMNLVGAGLVLHLLLEYSLFIAYMWWCCAILREFRLRFLVRAI